MDPWRLKIVFFQVIYGLLWETPHVGASYLGVSKNRGTRVPQNGWWKKWKTLSKWMIWGDNPLFLGLTPIWTSVHISHFLKFLLCRQSLLGYRNPTAVSALCCLVGLALSVISILSIIGVARMDDEKSWTPRDSLQMFYQFLVHNGFLQWFFPQIDGSQKLQPTELVLFNSKGINCRIKCW